MSEKEQKDLIKRFKSLKQAFEENSYIIFMWAVSVFILCQCASNFLQSSDIKELHSKNEELRKIICDIHKDTNTPAPKDFKANKFVTGGYKYDPNFVKKLRELCKSNTH